jgi:hypothetical protein
MQLSHYSEGMEPDTDNTLWDQPLAISPFKHDTPVERLSASSGFLRLPNITRT